MNPRSTGELWRDLLQRRAKRERIARVLFYVVSALIACETAYILFH